MDTNFSGWFCFLVCHTLYIRLAMGDICNGPICEYDFVIRQARSMTISVGSKVFNVELNDTQLQVVGNSFHPNDKSIGMIVDVNDVITADGFPRDVITINGQFPGPTLQVMEGTQVVVRVKNELVLEATTIHFHGLSMRRTPWMDGSAYVAQCPILPRQSFTYRFLAEPAGTHWYHAHFGMQRLDGLYGVIVVHRRLPAIPEHVLTIGDWFHQDAATINLLEPYAANHPGPGNGFLHVLNRQFSVDNNEASSIEYVSGLINGRGRWNGQPYPLSNIIVKQGLRYRFRSVNVGAEYSLEVMIDQHELEITASDGSDIEPIKATSVIVHPGETIDFEITANQNPGKYWIRARTVTEGEGLDPAQDNDVPEINAVLTYNGTTRSGDPLSATWNCSSVNPCKVFNCPFHRFPTSRNIDCIPIAHSRSVISQESLDKTFGLKDDDDVEEYFFNFAFPIGSSINGRKYVPSSVPFSEDNADYITPCDKNKCDTKGCACTNIEKLPFNKTVQFVLTSFTPGEKYMSHHAPHLHGHQFAVLAQGFPDQNQSTGRWVSPNKDIICMGENEYLCSRPRWNGQRPALNKVQPPVKDTIMIPSRGYLVVRFRTDNPGYWSFHCHQELHFIDGMTMVLGEATELIPPPPRNFPRCGSFRPSAEEFQQRLAGNYTSSRSTISTPKTPTEATHTPAIRDCDGEKEESDTANTVKIPFKTAIGLAFAFIIVGSILTLVPILLFACCAGKKSAKYGIDAVST